MELDIRSHIINNFRGDDMNTLKAAIEESIENKDEITLPGMGVFFELVWQDSTDGMKDEILNLLKNRITGSEK